MDIKTIFSLPDQFKYILGIEGKLRQRRVNSLVATIATILVGILSTAKELVKEESVSKYLSKFLNHTFYALKYFWYIISFQWDLLPNYQLAYDVIGIYIIILGIVIYYLYRHTSFLLKKSEEPFQYTFWIERFIRAEDKEANKEAITEDDQIHHFLHHDLMDMLNRKIGRFSLLDDENFTKETDNPEKTPPSHIHIDGHYAIRRRDNEDNEDPKSEVIEVMPRVRIGPKGNPSILTHTVEIELVKKKKQGDGDEYELNQEIYEQVLEQVYSKIASEIYKQIKTDIDQKMQLFPTAYLRAVALYYEADDFSRSNTIDSYDYAIELYKKALRYYDISIRSVILNWLIHFRPLRLGIEYEMMHARTKIGYAKSLIYRREISSLTGRTKNALYEVHIEIPKVVNRLLKIHNKFHIWKWKIILLDPGISVDTEREKIQTKNRLNLTRFSLTFKKDTWKNKYLKHKLEFSKYEQLKKILFDSFVVLALTHVKLGDIKEAKEFLDNAKAAASERCDSDALFLLTKAEVELDIASKIPYLIQATEMAPDFEIAQYLLAKYRLLLFLSKGELEMDRAETVIKEFTRVLEINPGNIASFANLGYLYWLLNKPDLAQKQFERGKKTKAIVQQTFIGELNYGLARIAAKHGEFNTCYNLYSEAISSDPGIGAYSIESISRKARTVSFYDYITPSVLSHYLSFKQSFEDQILLSFTVFHETDFIDFNELKKAFDNDKYQITDYQEQRIAKNLKEKVFPDSGHEKKEITRQLNDLLYDGDFYEYILTVDNCLTDQINQLKEKLNYDTEKDVCIVRLNRYILEILYPEWIKICNDEEYFHQFVSNREIIENQRNTISINILKKSYSYVLNDYGNACLNFYHRYGDCDQLEYAIESFKKATDFNLNNGIAYYNDSNALFWRHREKSDPKDRTLYEECLEKANSIISPPWQTVIVELVSSKMNKIKQEVIYAQKKIEKLKKEVQKILDLSESLSAILKKPWDRDISGIESIIKDEKVSFLRGITPPRPIESRRKSEEQQQKILLEIEELIKRLKEILPDELKLFEEEHQSFKSIDKDSKYLKSLRENVENGIENWTKRYEKANRMFESQFISTIKEIVELGKLTSVIEGLGIDVTGSSVKELLKLDITLERLDERDIELMLGWSELLSLNESNKYALNSCIKLCEQISKYTSKTFDIDYTLWIAFKRLEELEIEEILAENQLYMVIPEDVLKDIISKESELCKILNTPPGESLELDDYRLDKIKDKIRSPYFKVSEIGNPEELIQRLDEIKDQLLGEPEINLLNKIKNRWDQKELDSYNVRFELNKFLNKLIQTHYKKNVFNPLSKFSQRTQQLINKELDEKLKGEDLLRFNRRLLEEIFPKAIKKSNTEIVRERICETIKQNWLASDPVHYLALDEWAKHLLILPELEEYLEKSITELTLFHKYIKETAHKAQIKAAINKIEKALAELYEKAGYEDDAILNFENLTKKHHYKGLYYLKLSKTLRSFNRFEEARGRLKEAKEKAIIDNEEEYTVELKAVLEAEAKSLLEKNEWDNSFKKYMEAIKMFPADDNFKNGLSSAQSEYNRYKIGNHYGKKWIDQLLVVTPVAMEVAADLIPLIEGKDGGLKDTLQTLVDQMRKKVLNVFGVKVPGIRFRGNETDLPDGTYIIMVNEIPLVSGNIDPNQKLFPGSLDEIKFLGIQGKEVRDPLTGEEAYWINEKDIEKLGTLKNNLWDTLEYPIRHLESVLQRNLAEFLGHQEVNDLIYECCPEKLQHYDNHPENLTKLTILLRGLVSEKVPITEFKTILKYFETHDQDEKNLTNVINNIRLIPEIKKVLPGNREKTHFKKLSTRLESEFQNAIHIDHGKYFLAISPEKTQDVLIAVRKKIVDAENIAIVVENTQLRPLVGQLLKLEFPNTPVISREELLQPLSSLTGNIEVIDLE